MIYAHKVSLDHGADWVIAKLAKVSGRRAEPGQGHQRRRDFPCGGQRSVLQRERWCSSAAETVCLCAAAGGWVGGGDALF